MENVNLNNSMISEASEPLAIMHTRQCETLKTVKLLTNNALDNYRTRRSDFTKILGNSLSNEQLANLLWITVPALENIQKILESIEE